MRLLHRLLTASTLATAMSVLPVAAASAQTTTMDFSGLGPNSYDPIPYTYGSHANLAVTNRTRLGWGNSQSNTCNQVSYWQANYSSLVDVAFPCFSGGVGEFQFVPVVGQSVTLNAMNIGSYFAPANGIGPARAFDVRVYDLSWNPLFAQTGIVTSTQQITFNVTSAQGLYLQFGTDWNVGVDDISTTVASSQATVPEPATLALLVPAVAGVLLARRRRAA
ncbi:MAG: PEP-CTERM sorting domain-containing protein [Gemmatimonadetes bacterium]|nr:PEP-CTERM sorting domain-containing protein [Gemmatimonadota bacterium]